MESNNSKHRREVMISVIGAGAALQSALDTSLGNIKGITYSEYRLLSAINASQDGSGSRVELARAVGLTASGVTRALRPLEKLGMVETIRHERDARRSLATLTDQGQELLNDAAGVVADTADANVAIQGLSPDEAELLLKLSNTLRS